MVRTSSVGRMNHLLQIDGSIPIPFAPTVTLLERYDEGAGRQHVDLTMDAPVLGRLYEYSGFFDYVIEDET